MTVWELLPSHFGSIRKAKGGSRDAAQKLNSWCVDKSSRSYMFAALQRQKISHFLRTVLLSAGMVLLMLLIGLLLMGWEGLIWSGLFSALGIYLSGRIPAAYIMRMYRARKLQPWEVAPLRRSLAVLAGRAGLQRAPDLYIIPSAQLNAFATGTGSAPAIGQRTFSLERRPPIVATCRCGTEGTIDRQREHGPAQNGNLDGIFNGR